MRLEGLGLGFWVPGLGSGFGFRAWDPGWVSGLGSGLGIRDGFRVWVPGLGSGFGFRVWVPGLDFGLGFRVWIPGLELTPVVCELGRGSGFRVWGLVFCMGNQGLARLRVYRFEFQGWEVGVDT